MNQPGTLEADLELSASSVEELAGTDALSGGAESDVHFQATCHPQVGQFLELAEHDPGNPFITPEYVQAQVVLGENVSLLTLNSGSRVVTACPVFVKGKFLKRRLQIVSLPLLPCPAAFWSGLLKLCRAWSVWMLEVDSYGSLAADIPKFPGELVRHARTEYVMDLDHDVFDVPCHNHRRDIARARKLGISIRRSREVSACEDHLRLMTASLDRRTRRGEHVEVELDASLPRALLASGAGELFQAVRDGEALASLLVLRSKSAGYYHSAGNSQKGMKWGASPFLLMSTADILKGEGAEAVNIGGTGPENAGLKRFKSGFGAREVQLVSACFCPGSFFRREVRETVRWAHEWAGSLRIHLKH
jgi:hypothetical protein